MQPEPTMSKAVQKIIREREAEKNQAPVEPPPNIAIDPMAAAHASIRMDGRTGRAFTKTINITSNPKQPRKDFDLEEIRQIASSFQTHGQLVPLRVEWSKELSLWVIEDGEKRWMAAQSIQLEQLWCMFIMKETPDDERLEKQLVTNALRSDLKPIELANAIKELMAMKGYTQQQVADRLKFSQSKVARTLQLLEAEVVDLMHGALSSPVRAHADGAIETHGASKPPKKKGKRGPKPGRVRIFKMDDCTITMQFRQKPTDPEIGQALREALEQHEQQSRAAA